MRVGFSAAAFCCVFWDIITKQMRCLQTSILLLVFCLALTMQAVLEGFDSTASQAILNYFGCSQWEQEVCIKCSDRYYFNKNGICCEVEPTCQVFNRQEGLCERCYQGYSIVDGKCKMTDLQAPQNEGCRIWGQGRCLQCSQRWYFDPVTNQCTLVSNLCRSWNISNGICETCYPGYTLYRGACLINLNPTKIPNDSLCRIWENEICMECAERAYFSIDRVCTLVSSFCRTWDQFDGYCLSCYRGYSLDNGECKPIIEEVSDPGCSSWDWDNQICLLCSKGYFRNQEGLCYIEDQLCKQTNRFGNCVACYGGYELVDNKCTQIKPVTIFNDEIKQVPLALVQKDAILCEVFGSPVVVSCGEGIQWDFDGQQCLCPDNLKWNTSTKTCGGRQQNNQANQVQKLQIFYFDTDKGSKVVRPTDLGCKKWDWKLQRCLECSDRFVSINGTCLRVSDYCQKWNSTGHCLNCYPGYRSLGGLCFREDSKPINNIGCKTWSWDARICLECSYRWYPAGDTCKPVNDQCASWSQDGNCTSCYPGCLLRDGTCTLQPPVVVPDQGCRTWDWSNLECLECSFRWVFNINRVCIPVDPHCSRFAEVLEGFGECVQCYKGYVLKQGSCVQLFRNVTDVGCKVWDWDNQLCLQCSDRWFFNQTGKCTPVNPLCLTWDGNGNCLSCYLGYRRSQGQCIESKTLCKSSDGEGLCLSCYPGYVLYRRNCIELSELANIILYYQECCPEKLLQLGLAK